MINVGIMIYNWLKDSVISEIIDIDFTLWLTWLLWPLLITFLLPAVIALLMYMTAAILYIRKWHGQNIRQGYAHDLSHGTLKTVAALWDAHGWIWHGYEVRGMENIPDNSPALLVYYHGAVPVDICYFLSRVYLVKNRLIHTVADRFLFRIPGFSIISETLHVIPGTVQSCSTVLRDGKQLLGIAPGGVYEAQFGNNNYQLQWKNRLGFAKVALEAKVPIIPVFTKNAREAFRSVSFGRKFLMNIYAKTKLPLVPIYGGFPVKLTTYVGEPIEYNKKLTPEQLAKKVAESLEALINKHQKIPGSILRALLERFY